MPDSPIRRGGLRFFVQGPPKPEPRARVTVGPDGTPRTYRKGPTWKDVIVAEADKHRPAQPLDCPLRMDLTFYFERPKAHERTGRHAGELKPNAPTWAAHHKRNDLDNLAKLVWDALQSMGFIKDDGLIVSSQLQKRYVDINHNPGVDILIVPADEECEPWAMM